MRHTEREQEKQRAAEKGLSLIESIILDDEELNFMKQVLIEVLKQNKCHYTNVLTLLNLFKRSDLPMDYKKREYDEFFGKRRLDDKMKNDIEELVKNKTQNIINKDDKVDELTNGIQNVSLEINNNNLSHIIMSSNVNNNIDTKRSRGRPRKPNKVDKDLTKLNEIPVNGKLNEFYKDYVVSFIQTTKNNKI